MPPSKFLLRKKVLVPHCLIAIRNCDDISHRASVLVHRLVFLSRLVPSVLVATDPVKVFRAIGRHVDVALLLSFHPVGLRFDAPVEDFVKIRGVEDAQRALAFQPSGTGVPTYTPHSTLVEQFSSQVSTTHTDPGPGFFSLRPIRDLSYYEPQARLNGEGRVGHFVALCSRQLFSLLFLLLLDHRTSVSA